MAHTAHLIPPPLHHTTPVEVSFGGLFATRPEAVASRRSLTTAVSVLVHGLLVAALIIVPLFVSDVLPPPSETIRAFLVSPPQVVSPPPPPPPPAPSVAGRRVHERIAPSLPQVARFEAPIEMPEEIIGDEPLELGIEGGVPGGVEGGVPGGVVGGIIGGLPQTAPVPQPQVVRVGGMIKPPKLLHRVAPEYPDLALQARVSSVVIMEAHVDVQGRVKSVKVLRSNPVFDEAAIAAVKQWRYVPMLLNGQPQEFVLTLTVVFRIANASAPRH